jgi:diguanylate cyclase (GGDEF)-like protein
MDPRGDRCSNGSVIEHRWPQPRFERIRPWIPQGRLIPDDVWRRRHRAFVLLGLLHVPGIVIFALVTGHEWDHALVEASPVGLAAVLASRSGLGRGLQSIMASLSLLIASAVLVHLSGGVIEMHFHFFVVVPLLALYQDWIPFLLAIGFVCFHHFVGGTLDPGSVFSHPAGRENPLFWSLVHGTYIAALSAVSLVAWSLSQHGFRDPLTNLANRSLFESRQREALRRAHGRPGPIVLFLDVDDFKTINDSLGHGVGDDLLRAVAERIGRNVRPRDTAARLGGDEFGLLVESASVEDGSALAERVLTALTAPFEIRGTILHVRVSIGVAFADSTSTASDLLRDADTAMYSAKSGGKNRYELFTPAMHDVALRRLTERQELQDALDRDELFVEYQPIYSVMTGRIVATEALVRWQHPVRGLVPPAEFIPLAEQSGLIDDLERSVLSEACEQTASWRAIWPEAVVSVNLSVRHLNHPNVVDDVAAALDAAGLDPIGLILEITESVLMDDVSSGCRALERLRDLGVRLAIDDFGTGHSSLSQLSKLRVDILKIDKSFVAELSDGEGADTIVGVVVRLAQILGLRTVAEGVEEPAQLAALRRAGCDEAQGFMLARPAPADAVTKLLIAANAVGPARRPVVGQSGQPAGWVGAA